MLCGAHMLVLRIIQELWQSSGGVFNVDEVLQQMVYGLEEELELRSKGRFASQKGPMAGGPDNDWVPSPMQWAAAAAERRHPVVVEIGGRCVEPRLIHLARRCSMVRVWVCSIAKGCSRQGRGG